MSTRSYFSSSLLYENIYNYTSIFFYGLFDAISLHKTLPTLVNNTTTVYIILKIFGANIGLIIGSEMLFRKGIAPFMETISDKVLDLQDINQYTTLLYLIYQSLWLVPICVLCYVCCLSWYQELADCIEKTKTGKKTSPIASVQYAIYGFLTWLFAFIQVQLLTGIIPGIINTALYVVDEILKDSTAQASSADNSILSFSDKSVNIELTLFTLKGFIHTSLFLLLHLLKYVTLGSGFVLMAVLYAWYAFDPRWISMGMTPNERFALIEKYFFYFLGFGSPFVVLNRYASFFIGFGSFLTIFPFCIILGSVLDYTDAYKVYEMKDSKPVKVFRTAQVWTFAALKMIGSDVQKKMKAAAAVKAKTSEDREEGSSKKLD